MKPYEFFKKLADGLNGIEQDIARDIVAVEAEQFHAKNFRDQGFTDSVPQPWPARKKKDKRPGQRALLVQTGTLRRHALKGRVQGDTVVFEFPLAYEQVHNEGGRAGRGAGFQMPKRQYVGESEYLKKRIDDKAKRYLDQHLKNL